MTMIVPDDEKELTEKLLAVTQWWWQLLPLWVRVGEIRRRIERLQAEFRQTIWVKR